jgi:hypothetical protein
MKIHPIFEDCCAKNNTVVAKFRADVPWIKDGYLYATNGHVAVRTPMPLMNSTGDFPPASTLNWNASDYLDEAIELSEPGPLLDRSKCKACDGKGNVDKKVCTSCEGGEIECNLGHYHECEECNGDGVITSGGPCYECDSTGLEKQQFFGVQLRYNIFIKDDNARFLKKYNAKLYLHKSLNERHPIRFLVDNDIEGIVMPYLPPIAKR